MHNNNSSKTIFKNYSVFFTQLKQQVFVCIFMRKKTDKNLQQLKSKDTYMKQFINYINYGKKMKNYHNNK